jgi:GNAT superfamily N-acetyltransferase
MFDPARLPAPLRDADDALGARLEDAGLTSSQPPQQSLYDGWLLRYSPGKAKRARSVNALAAGRLPLAEKLQHVDAFYARVGLPAVYRVTPYTLPAALDGALAAAGYEAYDESRVMWAPLPAPAPAPVLPTLTLSASDPARFVERVGELRGSPPAVIAAERERLAASALPGHYLVALEQGGPVACGCVLLDGTFAGVFNMVTAEHARGRGLARAIVAHLLQRAHAAGARLAYLQVDAANAVARRVYARFGFRDRYAYWYRARPDRAGDSA